MKKGYRLHYCTKLACTVFILVFLYTFHLMLHQPTLPDDYDRWPPPPHHIPAQPQRKLTHIPHPPIMSPYLHIYNLSQPLPNDVALFDCAVTKTQPPFHICVYEAHKDKYISAAILSPEALWEPYITRLFQKALHDYPNAVVIDIGANIGYYTLLSAMMGHKAIAIEPAYENIVRLHKGVALNKCQHQVTVLHNAVSSGHRNVTLTRNKDNQGGVWIQSLESAAMQERVMRFREHAVIQTIILDEIIHVVHSTQAIIKVDIEGFECHALARAHILLTAIYVPFIFMEWQKMYIRRHYQQSPCPQQAMQELADMLTKLGYIPYEVNTGFQLDASRAAVAWKIGDLYWRHQSAHEIQDPY